MDNLTSNTFLDSKKKSKYISCNDLYLSLTVLKYFKFHVKNYIYRPTHYYEFNLYRNLYYFVRTGFLVEGTYLSIGYVYSYEYRVIKSRILIFQLEIPLIIFIIRNKVNFISI